jgi:hypothetical protein
VLFLPLVSLALMIWTAVSLRYSHQYSTDHPTKGGSVDYQLRLTAGSCPIPTPVEALIQAGRREDTPRVYRYRLIPPPGLPTTITERLHCAVRGIYTLGLARLRVFGLTGSIWVDLSVWQRTFYVYPRVHTLPQGTFGWLASAAMTGGVARYRAASETAVRSIAPYYPGVPLNRVAWKRFAALGYPVIKEFDTGKERIVQLVLDTRIPVPVAGPSHGDAALLRAEVEDCSVEIFLSVLRALILEGFEVKIHAPGWIESERTIRTVEEVNEVWEASIGLFFRDTDAFGFVADSTVRDEIVERFVVTHRWDGARPAGLRRAGYGDREAGSAVIYNTLGWTPAAQNQLERDLMGRSNQVRRWLIIRNGTGVAEELSRWYETRL